MLERAREISEGVLLERMLRSDYESLAKKDDYLIDELRAELKAMSVPPTPEEWARFESNQERKTAILAKNIRLSLALSALKDSLHVQLPLENRLGLILFSAPADPALPPHAGCRERL